MKDLMKKLGKAEDSEMSEVQKMAKKAALKELMMEMSEMMNEDLDSPMEDSMQQVTVAAKNPEDLMKGLSKAEDLIESLPAGLGEEGLESEESEDDEDMM